MYFCRPRLKNVDRSTAEHNEVTVNNVTVIITEFQPKNKSSSGIGSSNGTSTSLNGIGASKSTTNGSTSSLNNGAIGSIGDSINCSSSDAGSISDVHDTPSKTETKMEGIKSGGDKC